MNSVRTCQSEYSFGAKVERVSKQFDLQARSQWGVQGWTFFIYVLKLSD